MACNAVATIRAKVKNEALAKLLTLEVIAAITPAVLKQLGYEVTKVSDSYYGNYYGKRYSITSKEGYAGSFRINPGGDIYMDDAYRIKASTFTKQLSEAMQLQAGRLLQRKVLEAVKANPSITVTGAQEIKNAMVINMEF